MDEGVLVSIWVKRAHRGPMDPLETVNLEAGRGIAGNADRGGRRQVTLLESERWEEAASSLGVRLAPVGRRANLLLQGVSLADSRHRVLQIGRCQIVIRGETKPCERMDELHLGLKDALWKDWKAGAYGEVIEGGSVSVGDSVRWVTSST